MQSTSGGPSIIDKEAQGELLEKRSEVSRVIRVSLAAMGGFAILYIVFLTLSIRFPYLRAGATIVAEMKHDMARSGDPFQMKKNSPTCKTAPACLHVMAFGNSKTLAGFIPKVFDYEMATAGFSGVESYNFGLPGDFRFVADLEAMAARGKAPDIALLTFPWPDAPDGGPSFFHFINNDKDVMSKLFPFRSLPSDFLLMAAQAHGLGGMKRAYLESERSIRQVAADRGYYFIARQSHYKNDELPSDLIVPGDDPNFLYVREVTLGPVYEQLAAVLASLRITCIFVPLYCRETENAQPPAINSATAGVINQIPNLGLVGPDYWRFPNHYFSDPVHLNRRGAHVYTKAVAGLVASWLKQHKSLLQ